MKLAILTAHEAVVGGAEAYLRTVIPGLIAHGHEIGIGFERPAPAGVRSVGQGLHDREIWSLGDGISSAIQKLERFGPELVYQHGLIDPALEAALAERFPSILFAHGYQGTCVTGQRAHSFAPRSVCTRTLGVACLGMNYVRGCGAKNPLRLVQLYRRNRARHDTLNRFRAVVVASNYVREIYIAHGCDPDRIYTIAPPPAGVVPGPEAPVRHRRSDRLLFLGRITRIKGALVAVDAVASASKILGRELTLVLAGVGPAREACLARARERGVCVDFRGWVEGREREELLRAADLLLVPSLWPEPFGMVGVEAGCFGVPSVVFAVGGIVDWLQPGVGGECATKLTGKALGCAIAKALGDEAHYQRLRRGAWAMATSRTVGAHIVALNALFNEVSGAAHPR